MILAREKGSVRAESTNYEENESQMVVVVFKRQRQASQLPLSDGDITSALTSCTPKSAENAIFDL